MSDALQTYLKAKKAHDDARSRMDKVQGALDALMARVREEYGVGKVKELEAHYQELRNRAEAERARSDRLWEECKEKWSGKFFTEDE